MQSTPLNFVPNAAKAPVTPGQAPDARWSREAIEALFALPFNDLLFQAQQVHRANFDANAVRESKRLVREVSGAAVNDALLADTAERIAAIRASEEGREGVQSFLGKRKPNWLLPA